MKKQKNRKKKIIIYLISLYFNISYNGLQFTRAWILEEDIYAPDLLDNFLKLREGRQTRATSKIMQDENKDYLNMATNLHQVPENLYTNDFFRHLDFFFLFS